MTDTYGLPRKCLVIVLSLIIAFITFIARKFRIGAIKSIKS
jgi:hypothetical protein